MNEKTHRTVRGAAIAALVISLGLVGAAALERGAIAAGQADAHDVGSGSGSAVVPAAATAPAQTTPAPATIDAIDPQTELGDVVQFARSGKGRLAIGAGLVLLVWGLRSILAPRVAWFKTPAGGYVLGFGSAAIFYVGGGLAGGVPITFNLICDAGVAAFAASGKWEALRDVLDKVGHPPKLVAGRVAQLAVVALGVGLVVSLAGCKGTSAKDVAIESSYVAATAAETGFARWDADHQAKIVAEGTAAAASARSLEEGRAAIEAARVKLAAYVARRDAVRVAISDAYKALVDAARLKDDRSIAAAAAAYAAATKAVAEIEAIK